ncbi:hypothetical protein V1478_005174 [Vespula squamosa]|uniref:Uncharacterized protein n=1 Tax=Vespula squamosa TaxID=30214 RepID=A0ABD2BDD9_VESSQ
MISMRLCTPWTIQFWNVMNWLNSKEQQYGDVIIFPPKNDYFHEGTAERYSLKQDYNTLRSLSPASMSDKETTNGEWRPEDKFRAI